MRKIIIKATSVLLFASLMAIPIKSSHSQITDFFGIAMSLIKKVSTIYTTAQTAQQVEQVLSQIACAKYKYDTYRAQITIKSCLTKAQFQILDVQLSSVYNDIASTAASLLSSNSNQQSSTSGQGQLAGVLDKLKTIAKQLKLFNDGVEDQLVTQEDEQGTENFTAAGLARSF